MKKKIVTVAVLGLVMSLSGCAAQNTAASVSTGTWDVIAEKEYDFPVNLMGYIDAENAISVGLGGEIHYYSPDAQNWPKADNVSLCRFGMDNIDGKICYTCGNGGNITKTTDGGKTFARKTNFGVSSPNACKLMSFCDKNNGIVASKINLAITSDGAETWKALTPPTEIIALRMESPEKFCCIGKDFNFYKTSDGGTTWENAPLNLPLGTEYLGEILNFAFSIDGEDMYTVFCIDKETKSIKSYSTADGWKTCTENTMPDVKATTGMLYLSHDGTVLTVTDALSKKATAIGKQ